MWVRTQYDDIVRVNGYTNLATGATANGLMIRQAISLKDPCMIDGYYFPNNAGGNLLDTAAAFQSSISQNGVTQTPPQQAQQVTDRIKQLTDAGINGPLLAVLPFDPNVPPAIPDSATSDERKQACDAYTMDPLAYVPNPYQITAPLKGTVYGFVKFVSQTPPADYDGFRIDTPLNLKGVQEMFFTVEGPTVDPNNRGPLFLTSQKTQGGVDVVHFDLTAPTGPASGTAALLVDLDQDPVQF